MTSFRLTKSSGTGKITVGKGWRTLILANRSVRREAKAVLFAELSKAVAHGMPLHAALSANARTVGESRESFIGKMRGADTRNRLLHVLIGIGNLFGHLNGIFYLLLAFRYADIERVARRLAIKLQPHAEQGLPLSHCMANFPQDFDAQEVAIVAAGEQWQRLPESLQSLSEFQVTERQLSTQGANVLYPFTIGYIAMGIVSFIMVVILPKFNEIFNQLGAVLPLFTQRLVSFMFFGSNAVAGALVSSGVIIINFFLVRALMNGNRLSLILLGTGVIGFLGMLGFSTMAEVMDSNLGPAESTAIVLVIPLAMLVILLGLPTILRGLESIVLHFEGRFEPLLRMLPFIGGAAQVEREARWLNALSVALGAGVPAAEAVRAAGRISGNYFGERSEATAKYIEQGHSIGSAAVQAQLLKPKMNHRLRLLDASPDYLAGLAAIADDSAQEAIQRLNRAGRITESLTIVLMAIVITFVLVALYLPLFAIPGTVGIEK